MFQGKMGAYLPVDRQEDVPVLWTHLPGHIQQACPVEKRGIQSGHASKTWDGVNRCLPVSFDIVAMNDANPMCFSRIVERGLLSHQLGFPFLPAPRTDNLHCRSLNHRLADAKRSAYFGLASPPGTVKRGSDSIAAALHEIRHVPGQRVCLGRLKTGG
jgi:hypothetical protein